MILLTAFWHRGSGLTVCNQKVQTPGLVLTSSVSLSTVLFVSCLTSPSPSSQIFLSLNQGMYFLKLWELKKDTVFEVVRIHLEHGNCFPGGLSSKEPACQCRRCKRCEFDPWVRKIPWRRAWPPTSVFLPGESCGQRSLAAAVIGSQRVGHD